MDWGQTISGTQLQVSLIADVKESLAPKAGLTSGEAGSEKLNLCQKGVHPSAK
jgi:hypothetical protein